MVTPNRRRQAVERLEDEFGRSPNAAPVGVGVEPPRTYVVKAGW